MKKNVAGQKIGAQMITASDGSVFSGAVTVYVTGDAGTQAAGSVGAGACTHEGNGYHTYAPAQAETNYDLIAFTFIGTGAVAATVQVYPSFPQTVDLSTGITAGTIATVSGNVNGSVGSVTGAVGSVTGAVGSVTGMTASDVGAIKAKTDNLPAAPASTTNITAGTITTVTNLTNAPTAGDLTATMKASVEAAVWDATMASHLTAGTTGNKLNAAASAGDPWLTNLPGAYGAGTAGKIVGDNLNATVSSRAATIDATERAAIADAILDRNMATGTDSGSPTVRTVRQALRFLRNKWSMSGTTLTVTKEDDATASWTATVTTDAAAVPIVGNDPA